MKRTGIVVIAAVLIGTGCSVRLDPKVPGAVGPQRTGTIGAEAAARGMPSRVGSGTFTVFAIPIAPVSITNGPGERLVMDQLKQTIATAGYRVVDSTAAPGAPVLQCGVNRFSFKNYTWLFPLVFTWGGIELDLKLVDAAGATRWQQTYASRSSNMTYSFDRAVNSAMSDILQKVARDVSSDGFQQACCGAAPAAAEAGATGD